MYQFVVLILCLMGLFLFSLCSYHAVSCAGLLFLFWCPISLPDFFFLVLADLRLYFLDLIENTCIILLLNWVDLSVACLLFFVSWALISLSPFTSFYVCSLSLYGCSVYSYLVLCLEVYLFGPKLCSPNFWSTLLLLV